MRHAEGERQVCVRKQFYSSMVVAVTGLPRNSEAMVENFTEFSLVRYVHFPSPCCELFFCSRDSISECLCR